jgi:hypothetical protein
MRSEGDAMRFFLVVWIGVAVAYWVDQSCNKAPTGVPLQGSSDRSSSVIDMAAVPVRRPLCRATDGIDSAYLAFHSSYYEGRELRELLSRTSWQPFHIWIVAVGPSRTNVGFAGA